MLGISGNYSHIYFHRDIPVLAFSHTRNEVLSAVIPMENSRHLPPALKRILHFPEEFVEREDDGILILNGEGTWLVDLYLSDREIPSNRQALEKYSPRGYTARQWMLDNHAASFTDCYWADTMEGSLDWAGIEKQRQNLGEFSVILDSAHYTGYNSALGGELEKFWFRSDGKIFLCKKTLPLYGVLNVREAVAGFIYGRQGVQACTYSLVRDRENMVIGCKCPAFTDARTELVTAYDLLEEYNATQCDDVYERIAGYAEAYGLPEEKTFDYLDMQMLVDFLIGNRDRHQGNIGFLRDADTLRIFSAAPVYDSGSSAGKEGERPEGGLKTTVNGLYPTFGECLSHVKDPYILDMARLPDAQELLGIMENAGCIPVPRREQLLKSYEEHSRFLALLQEEAGKGRK